MGNYYDVIALETNIAEQLLLLKARLKPTSWEQEKEVLARYKLVLRAPNRTKIEAWVTSWQKVLTEAKQLDLPDTKNLRPTLDFLALVASINPAFSDYWNNRIRDKANAAKEGWQKKIPDGIKISDLFEHDYRSQKVTDSKSAFAATFQQEESPQTLLTKEAAENKEEKAKKKSQY